MLVRTVAAEDKKFFSNKNDNAMFYVAIEYFMGTCPLFLCGRPLPEGGIFSLDIQRIL